jgi:PAS domain S-box-containing protein
MEEAAPSLGLARAQSTLMSLVQTSAEAGHDHDAAIARLLGAVRDYFGLPLAIVSSVERNNYTVEQVIDASGTVRAGDRFDLAETYCERVIALERPLYVHKASDSLYRDHPCYRAMQLETYIGARLFAQGRVYGTLNLTAPDPREQPFGADDMAVFETAAALIGQHIALRMANERFHLAVEGSSVGLWDWDVRTDELFWSPRFMEIVGLDPADFKPTFDEFGDRLHPVDRDRVMLAVNAHMAERKPFDIEYRLRHESGFYVWIHARGQAVWAPDGTVLRMAGSVDDITARKAADRKLHEQAEALRQSNAELERFAYVASHDLQEPLRKISAFGDLLKRDYADRLDQRGVNLLGIMVDGAGRMQRLIRDLLDYSRSTHVSLDIQDVDLGALVKEVAGDFDLVLEQCAGRIECDAAAPVRGDPVLMRQLVHNLLGNAVKYRCADRSPVIRVTTAASGDLAWHIRVDDNGIGFAPEHARRIFEVFKRLHGRGDYPGTGIGLALCQRIVERHGGEIWAEGRPGEGASFHIEWPRDPKDRYSHITDSD